MKPPYKHELNTYARDLRRNATRHEKHLWYDFLCHYPVRFSRQRPIDDFIVDFYCEEARLVIELDGSQHYESKQKAYDAERTDILEHYGILVLRFSNADIDRNFRGVCAWIDENVKRRTKRE